jgi:hypothetical protein
LATSFGWNEKGKRKKISNANLKILEPRRKQKKKKDKSPAAAASHRHTRSSILLYARLLSKKKNLFHHQVRALWSKVLHDRFGMRSPFKLRRNTHKPQQQQQRQRPE